MSAYETNRSKFPPAVLERLAGNWVAFSIDGSRILASAETISALEERLVSSGEDPQNVALEWIELEDSLLGGAEIL